jgi:hypothetical protein
LALVFLAFMLNCRVKLAFRTPFKIKASFRWDYAYDGSAAVIVKNNDLMYGLREEDDTYYVYTHTESVMKSVTFWLIRKSNTWKRIRFKTFLQALALESYDTVNLNFGNPWVAAGPVNALVESSVYDSADNTVELVCWVPVVFGSLTQHPLAWSGSADPSVFFPYVPVGVSPQPRPAFYSGDITGLLQNIVGLDQGQVRYTPLYPKYGRMKLQSLTNRGEAQPSDSGDETPWDALDPDNPPAPAPFKTTKPDYTEAMQPDTKEEPVPLRASMPGVVAVSNGDGTYQVDVYPFGLDGKKYTVKDVQQLQIAPNMDLPVGTWVLVTKTRSKDGTRQHHYMQCPVWLA